MNKTQREFLDDQFFAMAFGAMAQRGNLYRAGAPEAARTAFRQALRTRVLEISTQYSANVDEEKHMKNISSLSDDLSASHKATLQGGRLRVGSAQKILNLFVKYLWCADLIPPPPHCPFDYIVLQRVPGATNQKWTKLDSMETYREIVGFAKTAAKGASLPEWELRLYNARKPTGRIS